ncbi:MAG: type II secretion system protein, partial [Alphaproteobacteria bacterium]|nr:type II secretion system protein [Alphaproteobacteria bacterium]
MTNLNLRFRSSSQRGFTLVELAIVLGVAAMMFAGLWRLMAGGNQQMRDQAAADQMNQLVSAAKGYLGNSEGQQYVASLASGGTAALGLPTNAADCAGTIPVTVPVTSGLCNFLPAGFFSGTTNSYGQTYSIRVRKDSTEAAGNPAASYSFMIMTNNDGEDIPDSSGGRIAGIIGNDGGFIYGTDVCGAPANTMACGAYGSWESLISTYFGAAGTSGRIAARTAMVSGTDSNIWLARQEYQLTALTGGGTPQYHTLQANT